MIMAVTFEAGGGDVQSFTGQLGNTARRGVHRDDFHAVILPRCGARSIQEDRSAGQAAFRPREFGVVQHLERQPERVQAFHGPFETSVDDEGVPDLEHVACEGFRGIDLDDLEPGKEPGVDPFRVEQDLLRSGL